LKARERFNEKVMWSELVTISRKVAIISTLQEIGYVSSIFGLAWIYEIDKMDRWGSS
jgi:hypothetical protein